jgi:hypothetical protein
MYDYTPNERIVDRAISIWIEMLKTPKYDNLGTNSRESAESIFSNRMASALAASIPKNNTDEVLTKFGQELKPFLMGTGDLSGTEYSHMSNRPMAYLSVDYHPDAILALAAQRAGLKMKFPWKTSMYVGEDYISVRNGYGASGMYHYPLSGDRWLVTALSGEDIKKIIALVEAGKLDLNLNPT